MRCPKCNGLMRMNRYQDAADFFNAWHCLICGEVIDQDILENRHNPPEYNPRKRARRRHIRH